MDRITWTTAAVNIVGLLVLGAVLIWAPEKSLEAVISFGALLGGSTLKGLFHGRQEDPATTVARLSTGAGTGPTPPAS
jgi:hypothetical protein